MNGIFYCVVRGLQVLRYLACGILVVASSLAYGQLYKCDNPDGTTTFSNQVLGPPSKCVDLIALRAKREAEANRRYEEAKAELDREMASFRKGLKVGDRTDFGLVIEVKRPIAKIQARDGETWFRIADLDPPGHLKRRMNLLEKYLTSDQTASGKTNP